LRDEKLLSVLPAGPIRVPGSAVESAALGYLHANCGSCHNSARPAEAKYFDPPRGLDLWLRVDSLAAVNATPTYRSAIGDYVTPGKPEESTLLNWFARDAWYRRRMPPIATKQRDPVVERAPIQFDYL
jgi:hypothetical protein